jgi:IPT/TIG domain/Regulator of chromosome condensation (RCC1) repeat
MEFLVQRRTAGWSSRCSALVLVAMVVALTLVIAGPASAASLPSVTNVEPNSGPAAGAIYVTITGTNFTEDREDTTVKFGSTNAYVLPRYFSETEMFVIAPPGVGMVDVTVTTPAGTSPISSADRFTYAPPLAHMEVMAWGEAERGQLGDGFPGGLSSCWAFEIEYIACSATPLPVSGLSAVTGISAGGEDSTALLSNGTVMAWGSNATGQLGDGSTFGPERCPTRTRGRPCSRTPVEVSGLSGVTAISTSGGNSLALLKNGTVMAWGGSGRYVPVAVSGLTGVTAIAAGGAYGLALLKNGTVMAWGANEDGELGNGTTTESNVPIPVSGLSGVSAISARGFHSLALLKNGTVMAWGANGSGELGHGTSAGPETCGGATTPCSKVPVTVIGLRGVTAVSAGDEHSLALLRNGTLMAWGANEDGELGNGTTIESNVPVAVSGLTGVTAVSAGDKHNLALLRNGTVMAWGLNRIGQLGDGVVGPHVGHPSTCFEEEHPCSTTPVAVSGLTGVTAIAAGGEHSLAYIPPALPPAVNKVKPDHGPAGGGTNVTISGTHLSRATAVKFGSTDAASFTVNSETSITAVSPAEIAGRVDVTVTTPGGISPLSPHDCFRFAT